MASAVVPQIEIEQLVQLCLNHYNSQFVQGGSGLKLADVDYEFTEPRVGYKNALKITTVTTEDYLVLKFNIEYGMDERAEIGPLKLELNQNTDPGPANKVFVAMATFPRAMFPVAANFIVELAGTFQFSASSYNTSVVTVLRQGGNKGEIEIDLLIDDEVVTTLTFEDGDSDPQTYDTELEDPTQVRLSNPRPAGNLGVIHTTTVPTPKPVVSWSTGDQNFELEQVGDTFSLLATRTMPANALTVNVSLVLGENNPVTRQLAFGAGNATTSLVIEAEFLPLSYMATIQPGANHTVGTPSEKAGLVTEAAGYVDDGTCPILDEGPGSNRPPISWQDGGWASSNYVGSRLQWQHNTTPLIELGQDQGQLQNLYGTLNFSAISASDSGEGPEPPYSLFGNNGIVFNLENVPEAVSCLGARIHINTEPIPWFWTRNQDIESLEPIEFPGALPYGGTNTQPVLPHGAYIRFSQDAEGVITATGEVIVIAMGSIRFTNSVGWCGAVQLQRQSGSVGEASVDVYTADENDEPVSFVETVNWADGDSGLKNLNTCPIIGYGNVRLMLTNVNGAAINEEEMFFDVQENGTIEFTAAEMGCDNVSVTRTGPANGPASVVVYQNLEVAAGTLTWTSGETGPKSLNSCPYVDGAGGEAYFNLQEITGAVPGDLLNATITSVGEPPDGNDIIQCELNDLANLPLANGTWTTDEYDTPVFNWEPENEAERLIIDNEKAGLLDGNTLAINSNHTLPDSLLYMEVHSDINVGFDVVNNKTPNLVNNAWAAVQVTGGVMYPIVLRTKEATQPLRFKTAFALAGGDFDQATVTGSISNGTSVPFDAAGTGIPNYANAINHPHTTWNLGDPDYGWTDPGFANVTLSNGNSTVAAIADNPGTPSGIGGYIPDTVAVPDPNADGQYFEFKSQLNDIQGSILADDNGLSLSLYAYDFSDTSYLSISLQRREDNVWEQQIEFYGVDGAGSLTLAETSVSNATWGLYVHPLLGSKLYLKVGSLNGWVSSFSEGSIVTTASFSGGVWIQNFFPFANYQAEIYNPQLNGPCVPPEPTPPAWNEYDTDPDVILSQDNRFAQFDAINQGLTRSNIPLSTTDPIYFELVGVKSSNEYPLLGMMTRAASTNTILPTTTFHGLAMESGRMYRNQTEVSRYNEFVNQDVIGFAYRPGNPGAMWIRRNGGAWLGGGDPVAQTSPTISNIIAAPYFIAAGGGGGSGSANLIEYLAHAAPSGFGIIQKAPIVDVTWDPTNKGSNITLSNGNLRAASILAPSQTVYITHTLAGDFAIYFESRWVSLGNSQTFRGSGFTINYAPFGNNTPTFYSSNGINFNVPGPGLGDTFNKVLGFACKREGNSMKVWIRIDGAAWVGGGDPETDDTPTFIANLTGSDFTIHAQMDGSYGSGSAISLGMKTYAHPAPQGFGPMGAYL